MTARASLIAAAQAFSPDAPVVRAFTARRGIRPGVEIVAMIPALFIAGSLPRTNLLAGVVITAVLCGLAVWSVSLTRTPYVVATTSDSALVLRCARLHPTRPVELARTMPLAVGVQITAAGDRAVTIAGDRYWVTGAQLDEARRVASGGHGF